MVAVALIAGGVGNSVGKLVGNGVGEIAAPRPTLTEKEVMAMLVDGFEVAAKHMNENVVPTMVDKETRLDRVSVGPGPVLTYHSTFLNLFSHEIDHFLIQHELFPLVKAKVCLNLKMKPSLQYGGEYAYSYSGKDGVLVSEFSIDRDDCGFSPISP